MWIQYEYLESKQNSYLLISAQAAEMTSSMYSGSTTAVDTGPAYYVQSLSEPSPHEEERYSEASDEDLETLDKASIEELQAIYREDSSKDDNLADQLRFRHPHQS